MAELMTTAGAAIAVLMVVVWLISVAIRDASIVDLAWGAGFVVVAWATTTVDDDPGAVQWLSVGLTTVWGLRLLAYLARRNLGHGEDFRYRAMRKRWGARFPLVSLVTVFGLQGVVMFVVSLPIQIVHHADTSRAIGPWAVVGAVVWLVGFGFEAVGDWQMARFKADPANEGTVMDQGLWGWTRHPNYFGDATLWWGLGLITLEAGLPLGLVGLIGPAVMTFFLVNVSGKALLERSLSKRREGYADYIARTSGFLPRPPRRAAGTAAEGAT